jgi:hypothetical protein
MYLPRRDLGRLPWLLLAGLVLAGGAVAEESAAQRTARVKAAFLLNISRYVEWPPQAFQGHESELRLCLLREDPFGGAIETIQGKYVGPRALKVQAIHSLEAAAGCNLLFVPAGQLAWFRQQPAQAANPLLTVTDLSQEPEGGPGHGVAMIALIRVETRIGLEIHLERARQAGLKLSSDLLRLGRILE